MFKDFQGLREAHANKIEAIMGRVYTADVRIGRQLTAVFDGLNETFSGKVLYEETAYGTPVTSVSGGSTYHLFPCQQMFAIETGTNPSGGLQVANGSSRRGYLVIGCANNASASMGFHQENTHWLSGAESFEVKWAIKSITNLSQPNTKALLALGVMSNIAANFLVIDSLEGGLTNKPANDFAYVEISHNLMRLVSRSGTGIITSPWQSLPSLTEGMILGISWAPRTRQLSLLVNQNIVTTLSLPENHLEVTGLQLFGRIGHTAGYTAGSPVSCVIDGIQAYSFINDTRAV